MSRWTDESNPNLLWMVQNLERLPWWCQKNKKNYPHPWGDHPIWRAYIWGWFNHQPAFGISCFVSLDFTHFDSNPTNSSCSGSILGVYILREDKIGLVHRNVRKWWEKHGKPNLAIFLFSRILQGASPFHPGTLLRDHGSLKVFSITTILSGEWMRPRELVASGLIFIWMVCSPKGIKT